MRQGTLFLSVVVALLCGTPALAQPVRGGVQLGLNMANFTGDDVSDDFNNRSGLLAGGFLNVYVSDSLSFQPEIAYVQKGAKDSFEGFTLSMALDYLEVPLLLRLTLPSAGNARFYFLVGPTVALNVAAKSKASFFGQTETEDIKEFVKDIEVGGLVGGGVGVELLDGGVLMFSLRYSLGLTSIDDSGADDDVRNRSIALVVGFLF